MNIAPVVLFVFNRPNHTKKVIESLQKNVLADRSDLIIYSDGERNSKDSKEVESVRSYIHSIQGFKSVKIVESKSNLGLAKSIINGVSEEVSKRNRVIVLEDDLITSPYFLTYMNEALDLYEKDEEVVSIHGYVYPTTERLPDTFFLMGADCWGWATWKRGWEHFDENAAELLNQLKSRNLTNQFDFDGAYPFTRMLEHQLKGNIDSWAIRWNASAFLKGKLTLYPGRSFIQNIGNDSSGTHSGTYEFFDVRLEEQKPNLQRVPLQENTEAKESIRRFLLRSNPRSFSNIIKRFLKLLNNDPKAS